MTFEWLTFHNSPHLALTLPPGGYVVILLYAALFLITIWLSRSDFANLSVRDWIFLIVLLAASPVLAGMMLIAVEVPGRIWVEQPIALLGLLPLLVMAVWLGRAPAALAGLLTGLAWALFETGRATQPFELALFGFAVATLINQRYMGQLSAWMRLPLVAFLLAVLIVAWPLGLIGIFATGTSTALVNLEKTVIAIFPTLLTVVGSGLIPAILLQVLLLIAPGIHPDGRNNLLIPPWQERLTRRTLYAIVPFITLTILLLVGVVAATSYQVATRLVIDQMARNAANAGSGIPFFIQAGRSLIRDLAQDDRLIADDAGIRQSRLAEGIRAFPYFQELIYFDTDQAPANVYPENELSRLNLSPEETSRIALALESGVPGDVAITLNQVTTMSYVTPVTGPDEESPVGVLLGRTTLGANPTLTPVIDVLAESFAGSGEGYLIDDQNRILLYPAGDGQQPEFFVLGDVTRLRSKLADGQAYRQLEADGTRQMIYILPVAGHSEWSVVVTVPNETVLELAVQIALPTLILLVMLTAAALPLIVTLMRRITVPIEQLLQAIELIGEGQLDRPVHVTGEDEIGRLGQAFEQMRIRLKGRLVELERLLNISRSVSSSLQLYRAMPPILSSALDSTEAEGVRIVLRQESPKPHQSYAAGELAAAMAQLDSQILDLVERQGTIVISQLKRAATSLDATDVLHRVSALVAFPLKSEQTFQGVLWLGYEDEHLFEQSEMTFLSTLAGQAAIAVANADLFTKAEERRQELEAVVASTTDAMIVTDAEGNIVLMNPAAEEYFNVRREYARGHKASDVIPASELATLLANPQEPVAVLQLPDSDGRTLQANTSTIVSPGGAITGRVAVLRDITAFKELDNIKTVFLRMVSHDLRSPLTYMQGYLSMIPLSGALNERQLDDLRRVQTGIDQISQLTERLLYLSRLQFGEQAELDLSLVDVRDIINGVCDQHSPLMQGKDITFEVAGPEKLPLLLADAILFRQAVSNLVQNAIKYTPTGGHIDIEAVLRDSKIVISVRDTGIGIRQEDQKRLFEAFYRVAQREGDPPRPGGAGLGLALVKAIARAHDGDVEFESQFGEGSTFSIVMPVRHPNDVL